MTQAPPPAQWQAPNMLLPTPHEFTKTADFLDKMLRWLRVFNIVAGVFMALAMVATVVALGMWRTIAESLHIPIDPELATIIWPMGSMYLVSFGLTVAFYYLTVLLINWCREYLTMLRGVALGGPLPQRARLEALHTTFSKYIMTSQWALPVLGVLTMLFPVILMPLIAATDSHAGNFGAGEILIWGLMLLFAFAPTCIINWLLLAALKRWLDGATNRMRGLNSGRLSPAAGVVGNWFIFVLVLLGFNCLGAIGNLFSPLFLGASLASLPKDDRLPISGGVITLIILAFVGMMLFTLAQQVIQFLAVMYSRTFAQQSAALLDAGPRPAPANLPMNSANPYAPVDLSKPKL